LEGRQEGECKTGIKTQLIAVALRSSSLDENMALLRIFNKYQKYGVSTIDFAGIEEDFIDPLVQKPYFDLARELGFHITLHCGEVQNAVPILDKIVKHVRHLTTWPSVHNLFVHHTFF
jgi:adenosine deaminase